MHEKWQKRLSEAKSSQVEQKGDEIIIVALLLAYKKHKEIFGKELLVRIVLTPPDIRSRLGALAWDTRMIWYNGFCLKSCIF